MIEADGLSMISDTIGDGVEGDCAVKKLHES